MLAAQIEAFDGPRCPLKTELPRLRPDLGLARMPMQLLRVPRLAGHTSLDHLIGRGKQRLRDGEAQRLGSTQIDHEIELARLLHREVSRFNAL
jgi:hypothetical protein